MSGAEDTLIVCTVCGIEWSEIGIATRHVQLAHPDLVDYRDGVAAAIAQVAKLLKRERVVS